MNRIAAISLDADADAFVARQLREGHFGSEAEVISAALRLLEERQTKLAALREAIREGEESGDAGPLDMKAIIAAARQQAGLPPRDG